VFRSVGQVAIGTERALFSRAGFTPDGFLICTFVRGCIQKFPDWPPGARTANGTALCH
jgi:hypothetical protein